MIRETKGEDAQVRSCRIDTSDQPFALMTRGWPKDVVERFMSRIDAAKGPVLAIDNLSKSYNRKKVLNGFTLNVFRGEIFGIVGVSGSGKTTLLEAVAGVLRPDHGQVRIKDPKTEELRSVHNDTSLRWWIGFSPQVPAIYPELTVRENLFDFASLSDLPKARAIARIEQLSSVLNLQKMLDERVGTLSKGWQKMADIAAALINEPMLLVLDEPARDLDPVSRKSVYRAIRSVNDTGTTVILSSHAISELSSFCTRIGVLHEGRLAQSVKPSAVSRSFYEIRLKTDSGSYKPYVERLAQAAIPATCNNSFLRVRTTEPEIVIRFLLDSTQALKETILDLEVTRPDISDLFEGWVKG